jgi:hypothetical protein
MTVSSLDREIVRKRANYTCEYCQRQEEIVGTEFEIDHLKPQSRGGADNLDNLAYACTDCNTSKADYEKYLDPISLEEVALFNPRTQKWQEHFQWSEDKTELLSLTAIGRATIACLQINRPLVLKARKGWVKLGWPPS